MSMKLKNWLKKDPGSEARILLIADLARRRDRLLETPRLDLPALERLLEEYESAGLLYGAANLRRRLEHYRGRVRLKDQPPAPDQ